MARSCQLAHLAAPAIQECLSFAGHVRTDAIPLLVCIAEKERPGRMEGLEEELLPDIQKLLGRRFHPRSHVLARGRVGGAVAADLARRLIHEERMPLCLVAGVDSFLVAATLSAYEAKFRLLTSDNSNGFIPGEAGAAVLLDRPALRDNPNFVAWPSASAGRRPPSIRGNLCEPMDWSKHTVPCALMAA